ncbi:RNA polymerase II transcription elongation factor-domain-containing protein [Lipomyces orientalis]|uniref:RNA polymerase II transcription elongation factor-domain-containing protein n=1 Tax=Lipomyces orientalis TaxID=1233043 RepID=A0ACC3TM51_9ASCO
MISPSDQREYPVRTGIGFGKHQSNSEQAFELKYNFKPDSIDDSRPSTLTRSGLEFTLESPGIQNGESFFFNGQHSETKDIDCLLVYDKETESFVLHHVSGIIRLKPQRSAPRKGNTEAPMNGYHHSQPSSSISSSSNSPTKSTTLKVPKDERVIELPSLEDEPDVESNSQPESRFDAGPDLEPTANTNANAKTEEDVPPSRTIARREPMPVSDEDESDADDNTVPLNVPARAPSRAPVQNVDDTSSDEDDDGDINMTNVPPQNRDVESSDEDGEDVPPPPRHAQPSLRSVTARGPISLRGYAGGGRVEDDISSSSEEE